MATLAFSFRDPLSPGGSVSFSLPAATSPLPSWRPPLLFLIPPALFNVGDFVPWITRMDLQGVQKQVMTAHRKYDALITRLLEEHTAMAAHLPRPTRPRFRPSPGDLPRPADFAAIPCRRFPPSHRRISRGLEISRPTISLARRSSRARFAITLPRGTTYESTIPSPPRRTPHESTIPPPPRITSHKSTILRLPSELPTTTSRTRNFPRSPLLLLPAVVVAAVATLKP